MDDPYAVLGVDRTATEDEIEAAYRASAKRLHPDRADHDDPKAKAAATKAFVGLGEARRTLLDPARRAAWHRRHDATPPPTRPAPPRSSAPPRRLTEPEVICGLEVVDGFTARNLMLRETILRRDEGGLWLAVRPYNKVPEGVLRHPDLYKVEALDAQLTDRDIDDLAANSALRHVELGGTQLDDAAVHRLCDLPKLSVLHLDGNPITDEACRSLPRLPALTDLSLRGTKLTDTGLRHLADCPRLSVLDVRGTAVTARGLRAVDGLRLRQISLPTRLSLHARVGGLKDFRQANPQVHII